MDKKDLVARFEINVQWFQEAARQFAELKEFDYAENMRRMARDNQEALRKVRGSK